MMTSYEFQPSKKSGRNRYVGKWIETPSNRIDLPYSEQNLRHVLTWGHEPSLAPHSHQDIAHWCGGFYLSASEQGDNNAIDERARNIAHDVECQWELFLVNAYTFEQLQQMNHGSAMLPTEWFGQWLKQLD